MLKIQERDERPRLVMRDRVRLPGIEHSRNRGRLSFSGYNEVIVKHVRTSRLSLACWVDFLVCPRRYLALLPARQRANLFAD